MKPESGIYLSLGSNLGNREQNIRRALKALEKNGIIIKKASRIIETDPVGGPVQGKFLNLVAEIQTSFTPLELLGIILKIEKELGRTRTVLNGPRTMDIDILLYEQQTIQTDLLTIPHPRMRERAFVMNPLQEIAPEIVKQLTQGLL